MSTALPASSQGSTGKPASRKENHTRGARASLTLGSSRAASGNALQARARSSSRSYHFKDSITLDGEGHGVSAAEAERGDAALQIAALQFVEQCDKDSCAACADRMAESDGAAIDVNFFGIELELARDGDGGNREGFVEFNEVYIFIAVPLRSDGRERRRRH